MNQLRVATWNAEGMFVAGSKTRRGTPSSAVDVLRELDADIVNIPEFGDINRLDLRTFNAIKELGYTAMIFPYGQPGLGDYGAAFLTRLPIERSKLYKFKNTKRQFIEVVVPSADESLRILGVHLDDRTETLRLQQAAQLIAMVESGEMPAMIMGDLNAMDRNSKFARFVRSDIAQDIGKQFSSEKLRSVATRVGEMALGTTLDVFTKSGRLRDLDSNASPTVSAKQAGLEWMPSVALAKIDWMLASQDISETDYRVWRDIGSDHRPVVADIQVQV